MKVARTVLNGGGEETYKATRLAPTQPRFWQQLKAGVRLQKYHGLPKKICQIRSTIRQETSHTCQSTFL